jgi:hypothetical protein
MTNAAQEYADRLIDTICECLHRCHAADDALDCAQAFVAQLRVDPTWRLSDTDRVERVVMRAVRSSEPGEVRLQA